MMKKSGYDFTEGFNWNLSMDTTFRFSWCLWNINISRVNQDVAKWRDYADALYDELEPLFSNLPQKMKEENFPEKISKVAAQLDHQQKVYNSLQHAGEFDPVVKSNLIGLLREYTSLLRKVLHALNMYIQKKESGAARIGKQFDMDFSEFEEQFS